MAKRFNDPALALKTVPPRGRSIPMTPNAGGLDERIDAGTLLDMSVGRALADAYYLDGTAGARIRIALGTAGAIGTGDFTFIVPHTVPATVQNNPIAMLIGDSEPYLYTSNGQGFRYDNTNNRLVWAAHSATGQLDRRYTNFQTTYAGKSSFLVARRTAGVLEVFWEGQLLTPNSTDQSGTSPPADFAGGLRSQLACIVGYGYTGTATLRQRCGPPILINAALSDAEIAAHAITGLLPIWCEISTGSQNTVVPTGIGLSFGATDGNSAGLNDAFNAAVSVQAGARDGGAGAYVTRITRLGIGSDAKSASNFWAAGELVPGEKLRLGIWIRKNAGGTITHLALNLVEAFGGGTTAQSNVLTLPLTDAWVYHEGVFTVTGLLARRLRVELVGAAGSDYAEVDDSLINPLGPIFQLVADPNFALRDVKANGLHATRTVGSNYLGNRVDSSTAWTVVHAGSGNLQFGGGTAIDTTEGWVIESLIVRSTAAVTWSLGNISAGAQHVSAYSLAIGDNYIPAASIVARNLSTANLWSNSNGAATITIYPVLRRTF